MRKVFAMQNNSTTAAASAVQSSDLTTVRRCQILFLQPASKFGLVLKNLTEGRGGLARSLQWLAYAGHLSEPVEINSDELQILIELDEVRSFNLDDLKVRYEHEPIDKLIKAGLLVPTIGKDGLDGLTQELAWHPLAKLYHMHGRWSEIHLQGTEFEQSSKRVQHTLPFHRLPPPYRHTPPVVLDKVHFMDTENTWLDELLSKRTTCRDFDETAFIKSSQLEKVADRVFRVRARETLDNGLELVRKNSPAGGSIHAVEAYFIIRRVEGCKPGIYHYDPLDHALELIRQLEATDLDLLVQEAVAGQSYFSTVPILTIMTARFDRLYWKYRKHSKAFKVCNMDAGHLSQNLYLTAAEMGLGVFVSAAVNDIKLEAALGLDPNREGVIAVCGLGPKKV